MATPGFLDNGIDFEQLIIYYLDSSKYNKDNKCYIEITEHTEVNLIKNLAKHVIDTSIGYNDDNTTFASTVHGRFQMIFNAMLEEAYAQKAGLLKRSDAIWRLSSSYQTGADFQSDNGKQIEAKVYKDWLSMQRYTEKGSNERTVFHGADYVLCYLIDSHEVDENLNQKHWYWLKKTSNTYVVDNNTELCNITYECLPTRLPVCSCKLTDDNKFIIKQK